ncbi:PspC domain-containing protein, partial [Isoptericola sp. QY 916]|uniref:PspC domain-containing protein n=1 Tax=Isoptericola sp. QY 916 TaxID=2782570 RepID=UPI003D300AA2|nr:PspC domain-containing protein [Isoptericola sp. QY 916]
MSTDDLPQPPGPQPGPGGAPAAGGTPPRRSGDGFFDSIRRMGVTRSDNRWVGGVAGGVAERFGLDPLLVRGLLILSFFLTGAGIVIYAIAWALLPERDGRIHLQQAFRGDFDVALLGAVVALIVGFAWGDGLSWWGFGIEWIGALLWVAVWVGIVWLVVKLIRDRRPRNGGPGAPPAPPYPALPAVEVVR